MLPSTNDLAKQYHGDIDYFGNAGRNLLGKVFGSNFDPAQAFRQSVEGAHSQFGDRLKESLARLRGSQVGMGRLDTGFAVGDEDRLVRQLGNDAQNQINSAALATNAQKLSHLGMLGQIGTNLGVNAMDARVGELHRQQDTARMDQRDKRAGWASLLSGALGGAGTLIGGPVGGFLGKLGGGLIGKIFG